MIRNSGRPKPHFFTAIASQLLLAFALWVPPGLFAYWIDASELAQVLLVFALLLYALIFSTFIMIILDVLACSLNIDHSVDWKERYEWVNEEFGMYYMFSGLIGCSPLIYGAILEAGASGAKLLIGLAPTFFFGALFFAPPFGKFGLAFSDILHKSIANLFRREIKRG